MSFARLLSEAVVSGGPTTGDVLAVCLPLLRQVDDLHNRGLVTGASGVSALDYDGELLRVRTSQGATEASNLGEVDDITARSHRSGIAVGARWNVDDGDGSQPIGATSGDVIDFSDPPPDRPVFVQGYRAWEQLYSHHDELTDIAIVGQWVCSYAFALDLDQPDGIDDLARHINRPSLLSDRLHPVVASTLAEMVNPDRTRRPVAMSHVIARLEHHRDIPADLDLSAAYRPDTDWRRAVLETLRDRVFDTTRRNRELYFKPTSTSVSLTEASVPVMLHVDRIQPDDLLTWGGGAASAIRSGRVDLAKWCRFEDAPYLAPTLDKLISADHKMRVETGHGRLQLIIAFLRWHDPETNEAVKSPLLSLPAKLERKKGVTPRYQLDAADDEAAVNPILRHVFSSRFGIELPETVSTGVAEIAAFVADLERQVRTTSPAVTIELIEKPRIEVLRRKAKLRIDTFRRRRARTLAASGRWRRQDFSYDPGDWRPLGQAIYQRFVRPEELPLRDLAGAPPRPRTQAANAPTETVPKPGEATSETYVFMEDDATSERWQVDLCDVTLAMLGSRRSSLARDYDAALSGTIDVSTTPFEPLFGPQTTTPELEPTDPIDTGQMLVLPADDAQARTVHQATRGDSFIIQGPPGTGKSQTIANIIAGLVANGKRVLFVCEKRAAIDVVAHRLEQVGMGDLTALIHDSLLDKKQFVADLGTTYHEWIAAESDPATPSAQARRDALVADVAAALRPINDLVAELGSTAGSGVTLAEAIERLARLSAMTNVVLEDDDRPVVQLSLDAWVALRPRLEPVTTAAGNSGLTGPLGGLAALRLAPAAATGTDVVATCRQIGTQIGSAVADLDPDLSVDDIAAATAWKQQIIDVAQANALPSLDPSSPQHLDLRAAAQRQIELQQTADDTSGALDRWSAPLPPDDTATALTVAQAKEGSFFRFLSGRWRKVNRTVRAAYQFDQHQIPPTVTEVLLALTAHHDAVAAVRNVEQQNLATYGSTDAVALRDLVDSARTNPAFGAMVGDGAQLTDLDRSYSAVAEVQRQLLLSPGTTVAELDGLGRSLQGTPVATETALLTWSGLVDVEVSELVAVLDAQASLDQIEAWVLTQALDRWANAVDCEHFSGLRIDQAVASVANLYRQILDTNAEVIVERARAAFLANVEHSDASMAGRTAVAKSRKRVYNAARRVVEREAAKKMRHRSIRELASGDAKPVVDDLRPIWLMSPLSVSDTLPLDTALFDTIIFDEASQIPVEDAVPAVLRAPQVIVVGDRMQMPPTRFFSTDDGDDNEIIVDEDGHRQSILLDSDSFLTQADTTLASSILNWHYRSRYESLIAYSNSAFYQGKLATIPDTVLPAAQLDAIEADDASDGAHGAALALQRPISFHHLPYARYHERKNLAEADYIAEMVRALLRDDESPTIGVVAFSEAQQGAIESALDDLATIDAEFASRYEHEQQRTDDGEYVGLFVKNLENVQGDERDVIIMSVCYGPDLNGRMRMNFGPINTAGGERRLNVIFSRARQHMAVVASIGGNDITNLHNEGAAHLAGFLNYAAAESQGRVAESTAILGSLVPRATAPSASNAVASEILHELRNRGWAADLEVGRSAFRIDIAVAVGDAYKLGVLLEPGGNTQPDLITRRYVAEAGVLGAFGWDILRVPLSDWFVNPDRVIERIEVAATTRSG